jgi:hypothetical protein
MKLSKAGGDSSTRGLEIISKPYFKNLMLAALLTLNGTLYLNEAEAFLERRNMRMVNNSEAYSNREDAIKSFYEERHAAGLDGKHIHFMIVDRPYFVGEFVGEEHVSTIYIDRDHLRKGVMRHEMKHAQRFYDGHTKLGGKWKFMPSELYEEWIATSYALNRAKEEISKKIDDI